jgi:polyferredoxin
MKESTSISLVHSKAHDLSIYKKLGLAAATLATLILIISAFNVFSKHATITLSTMIGLYLIGALLYTWGAYGRKPAGIKNDMNWRRGLTDRGNWGWILGVFFTGFYVLLYWYPQYLGLNEEAANSGVIALFDPLSQFLSGNPASQWFMYGTLYTVAILFMGIKFIYKYRHNIYQVVRTISVMFFQLGFAFLLPEIMLRLNQPYFDLKNIWPLNYYAFFDWRINELVNSGQFGIFLLFWSVALILIVTPILTYFYGKRWYCSWVCGCGGLAETAGDPWRHLSDNSLRAWKIERWMVHSVLAFVVIMTTAVLYSYFRQNASGLFTNFNFSIFMTTLFGGGILWVLIDKERFKELDKRAKWLGIAISAAILLFLWQATLSGRSDLLFISSLKIRSVYGFLIGAAFSGVVGVGFYPLLGNRVWCRFGCPMAAILGIQQRFFSKFRITSNGNQCISCGNCSTYCEMGIDVKWYAQRGQDIVRASCVGCGICSAVCPRGVLRLESGPDTYNKTDHIRALQINKDEVVLKS